MGESKRRMDLAFQKGGLTPGEVRQIEVDLKNATQKACACGCKYFVPVVAVYTVSALLSPTGQALTAQVPVLVCKDCGELFKVG